MTVVVAVALLGWAAGGIDAQPATRRPTIGLLSTTERLPTTFKPVSPPPYLNGGPRSFLSWVIECADPGFAPATVAEWLEGRLPRPVSDLEQWRRDD